MSSNIGVGQVWRSGDSYEAYVGRWSRLVAQEFLAWLGCPRGGSWLDVGCGTGVLSRTVLQVAAPSRLTGIDRSEPFIRHARLQTPEEKASFAMVDAQALPFGEGTFDNAVSGLVLNYVPRPESMVAEMLRVLRSGGSCALYVWDYAGQMQMIKVFWDSASELDGEAAILAQGKRFPICQPEPLRQLFNSQGATEVEVRPIDVPTIFQDFDDYWSPFLLGQGPAPSYAVSLSEEQRAALRDLIRSRLPVGDDGSIRLTARAWAVKATRP